MAHPLGVLPSRNNCMNSESHKLWLFEWFSKKVDLPENYEEKNYFDEQWIDSLGVMFLVGDIESEFNCQFDQESFQDRRFSTIKGLSEIISELRAGTN